MLHDTIVTLSSQSSRHVVAILHQSICNHRNYEDRSSHVKCYYEIWHIFNLKYRYVCCVITVPADVQAPNGALSPAAIVLSTQLHIISTIFPSLCWFRITFLPDGISQNGRRDLEKTRIYVHNGNSFFKKSSLEILWPQTNWINTMKMETFSAPLALFVANHRSLCIILSNDQCLELCCTICCWPQQAVAQRGEMPWRSYRGTLVILINISWPTWNMLRYSSGLSWRDKQVALQLITQYTLSFHWICLNNGLFSWSLTQYVAMRHVTISMWSVWINPCLSLSLFI